jgi:hypothetical protein
MCNLYSITTNQAACLDACALGRGEGAAAAALRIVTRGEDKEDWAAA